MIHYKLVWMGPVIPTPENLSCGRIELSGLDEGEYLGGKESIAVPLTPAQTWSILSLWLQELKTENALSYDELRTLLAEETGYWLPER
jgi:hypothetical protein